MKAKITRTPKKAIEEIEKINKAMKGKNNVKVGLPKDSNDYPDGTSVIMVGLVHEFGSPTKGIPERSFLRSTVNDKRSEYKKLFSKLAKAIIDGKIDMEKALNSIGTQVQGDIIEKMTAGIEPKLKHRDGTPLIDTGHLRQSITYKIEKEK